MFAIAMAKPAHRRGMVPPPWFQVRAVPMRTLRQIKSASLRVGPHWFLCVFLGAYVTMNLAVPGVVIG
jgi:hypothetical protein